MDDAIEVVVERRLATTDDALRTPAPPATVVQQEVGALEGVYHQHEDGQCKHAHGRRHARPVGQLEYRFVAGYILADASPGGRKFRVLEQEERAEVGDAYDEPGKDERLTDAHLGVDPEPRWRPG